MKLVFIASPFRAGTDWGRAENVRVAERAALEVWQLGGAAAICPQANSALFHGEAPDRVFLDGYLAILRRCDAVLAPGGWSAGVNAEIDAASKAGIPIFKSVAALELWIREVAAT